MLPHQRRIVHVVDVVAPVINSVTIAPGMVAGGDSVRVVVDVEDSVAVTSVTADAISLTRDMDGMWRGLLVANPALGNHVVSAVATDAASNTSTSSTATYRTARVFGTGAKAITNPATVLASQNYLFKVWGKASCVTQDGFLIDDGSGTKIAVVAPGHTAGNGDFVSARGVLDATPVPATLTCTADTVSILVAAALPTGPLYGVDVSKWQGTIN